MGTPITRLTDLLSIALRRPATLADVIAFIDQAIRQSELSAKPGVEFNPDESGIVPSAGLVNVDLSSVFKGVAAGTSLSVNLAPDANGHLTVTEIAISGSVGVPNLQPGRI